MIGPRIKTELAGQAEGELYLRDVALHVCHSTAAGEPSVQIEGLPMDEDMTLSPDVADFPSITTDWQAFVDALRAAGAEIR
jgi:hypothetical protein